MKRMRNFSNWNRLLAVVLLGSVAGVVACRKAAAPAVEDTSAKPMTAEQRKAAHIPVIRPQPRNIYPSINDAPGDLKAALKEAKADHKRIILDFGGDWCGDCQVLDVYFRQSPNDDLLDKNFVKVNINIGHEDANTDIAHKYGVPLHGVPALAVLDANGKVLFSQDTQFSDMRYMEAQSVTDFLNKWKG
ncbi:MAG: thioredoxin family protein [Acidobacteriaceae bacterium]|nr:thioredoxin family protein [Acidobacteriaceae bacterium]